MVTVTLAFQSLLTFAFLYAVIFVLERKKRKIDAFLVAVAAVVPIISAFLLTLAAGLLGAPMLAGWLWIITLIGVTFLMLIKTLEMTVGRAAAYTVAVFLFGVATQVGLMAFV